MPGKGLEPKGGRKGPRTVNPSANLAASRGSERPGTGNSFSSVPSRRGVLQLRFIMGFLYPATMEPVKLPLLR